MVVCVGDGMLGGLRSNIGQIPVVLCTLKQVESLQI